MVAKPVSAGMPADLNLIIFVKSFCIFGNAIKGLDLEPYKTAAKNMAYKI